MSTRLRIPTLPALVLVLVAAACEWSTEPTPIVVQDATLEAVGDTTQLVVSVLGTTQIPQWESLNPEVVTVTTGGQAVAVAPGTARVRATVGFQAAEGIVTVLPPVEVQLLSFTIADHPSLPGVVNVTARVRNLGGRGLHKIDYWQLNVGVEGEHRRIVEVDDLPTPVGMAGKHTLMTDTRPDMVIVYSRESNVREYRMTGCLRVDGGTPCPVR